MKMFGAALALTLTTAALGDPSSAHRATGTPDQDVVIANMRFQFAQASTAIPADLPALQNLRCLKRWALRDQMTDYVEIAKLEAFGSLWRFSVGPSASVSLAATNVGLQGSYQSGSVLADMTFRLAAQGQWVYEITIAPQEATSRGVVGTIALSDPQRVATAYALCTSY